MGLGDDSVGKSNCCAVTRTWLQIPSTGMKSWVIAILPINTVLKRYFFGKFYLFIFFKVVIRFGFILFNKSRSRIFLFANFA